MKLLLVNSNPIVQKLVRLSAEKVDILVVETDSLENVETDDVGLVFVDDKSFTKGMVEEIARLFPEAKLGYIYSKNSSKEAGFSIYVQKPFLPTDFVELLKNETIGMDKKSFVSPAAETMIADDALNVTDAENIPDSIIEESLEESLTDKTPEEGEDELTFEEEFDPDSLPHAPEGSTEGLEGLEGLDTDVNSILGGDDEKQSASTMEDLDGLEGLENLDGLEGLDDLDLENNKKSTEGESSLEEISESNEANIASNDTEANKKEENISEDINTQKLSSFDAVEDSKDNLDAGDLSAENMGLGEVESEEQLSPQNILDSDDIAEVRNLLDEEDETTEIDLGLEAEPTEKSNELNELNLEDGAQESEDEEIDLEALEESIKEDISIPDIDSKDDSDDLNLGDELNIGDDTIADLDIDNEILEAGIDDDLGLPLEEPMETAEDILSDAGFEEKEGDLADDDFSLDLDDNLGLEQSEHIEEAVEDTQEDSVAPNAQDVQVDLDSQVNIEELKPESIDTQKTFYEDESDKELQALNEVDVGAALGEQIELPEETSEIPIDEALDVAIPAVVTGVANVATTASESTEDTNKNIEDAKEQKSNNPTLSAEKSSEMLNVLQNLPLSSLKQLLNGMQITISISFPDDKK